MTIYEPLWEGGTELKHTLEFRKISKEFSGVQALRDISFSVVEGEVLALVGENGAGKSTLLKILNGDYQSSSGNYVLDGKERHFSNPNDAIIAGIGLIYQERQMFDELTVAENIFVGRLPKKRGLINYKELNSISEVLIKEFGLPIKANTRVKELSVAMQQMVEILKVYSRNPTVIAFDEPTACLSDKEAEVLFKLIERLRIEGLIIIYVSHRMNEVFRLSDKIVVLKDGTFVALHNKEDTNEISLVNEMVGRPIKTMFQENKKKNGTKENILKISKLEGLNFHDISFELEKGEILGFFGLVGAGRTEVMRAIFGADRIESGSIEVEGNVEKINTTEEAIKLGIAYCTEDRKNQGIIPLLSVKKNMSLVILKKLCRGIFISEKQERIYAKDNVEKFNIKTSLIDKKIYQLSGGNQQKVMLARWLSMNPKILILDEPTKGIDIGAKSEIYKMIVDIAQKGVSVILVSSELPEVIGLSDRIIVMRNKRIVKEISKDEASEKNVLRYAMLEKTEE